LALGGDQVSLKELRSRTGAHRNNNAIKQRFDACHFKNKNMISEVLKTKQYSLVNWKMFIVASYAALLIISIAVIR